MPEGKGYGKKEEKGILSRFLKGNLRKKIEEGKKKGKKEFLDKKLIRSFKFGRQ